MPLTPDQKAHYDETKQPGLIAGFVLMLVLSNGVLLVRIGTQFRLAKRLLAEDCLIITATIIADGILTGYLIAVHNGLGLHTYRVVASDPNLPQRLIVVFKAAWASAILQSSCLLCIKLSLLFFYRRIFLVSQKWLKVCWWINVIYAVLWTIGSIFFFLFQCKPVGYYWNRLYLSMHVPPPFPVSGSCPNQVQQISGPLITSLISDVMILLLPIATLLHLQISKRRKIGLLIIFSFGTFACISALVRITVIFRTDVNQDPTWGIADFLAWTGAELCLGIVCACVPIITSHIGLVMEQLRTRRSHSSNYSGLSGRGIRLPSRSNASQPPVEDSQTNLHSKDLRTIEVAGGQNEQPPMPTGQISS